MRDSQWWTVSSRRTLDRAPRTAGRPDRSSAKFNFILAFESVSFLSGEIFLFVKGGQVSLCLDIAVDMA